MEMSIILVDMRSIAQILTLPNSNGMELLLCYFLQLKLINLNPIIKLAGDKFSYQKIKKAVYLFDNNLDIH